MQEKTIMRLEGKTAIITGSGSGFGEGIAKTFAREGAAVVVNDVNAEGGARVVSEPPASSRRTSRKLPRSRRSSTMPLPPMAVSKFW
jgi:NAD(P)-dependent dehydrogenase (short-subunit alcohol dehydrogenase family)